MIRVVALASILVAGCYNPTPSPNEGYYCHPEDTPACPQGQQCVQVGNTYRCRAMTGGGGGDGGMISGTIPKTGNPYTGQKNDPGLNMLKDCPDNTPALEPNDGASTAIPLNGTSVEPKPDQAIGKLTMMSICPKGPRPETMVHDVDYYKVDTTTYTPSSLTLMAEIFYDISYGDLDVGIFDETGRILAADGSAVTNGCSVATVSAGVYYVVIVGANNTDVNRYDMRVRTFSSTRSCPTPGTPMDMSP
jgi:hypothetical protein